jgi:hypothetical protein
VTKFPKQKEATTDFNFIFIAGPHSGDQLANTAIAIDAAEELSSFNFIPFCPHLFSFWHLAHYHEYDFWMHQTISWLHKCDGVLRLPGKSPGADQEVKFAKQLKIPVFKSVFDVVKYRSDNFYDN